MAAQYFMVTLCTNTKGRQDTALVTRIMVYKGERVFKTSLSQGAH